MLETERVLHHHVLAGGVLLGHNVRIVDLSRTVGVHHGPAKRKDVFVLLRCVFCLFLGVFAGGASRLSCSALGFLPIVVQSTGGFARSGILEFLRAQPTTDVVFRGDGVDWRGKPIAAKDCLPPKRNACSRAGLQNDHYSYVKRSLLRPEWSD